MDKKLISLVAAIMFFGSLLVLQGVFGQQDAFTIENPGLYTTDAYQVRSTTKSMSISRRTARSAITTIRKERRLKSAQVAIKRTPRSPPKRPFTIPVGIVTGNIKKRASRRARPSARNVMPRRRNRGR
jgi:hypothetical protein